MICCDAAHQVQTHFVYTDYKILEEILLREGPGGGEETGA